MGRLLAAAPENSLHLWALGGWEELEHEEYKLQDRKGTKVQPDKAGQRFLCDIKLNSSFFSKVLEQLP